MDRIVRPIIWFYHEFGLDSITLTGRNAYVIILSRTLRMFAYGTNGLILALFFAELKFSDYQIGLFMTLTLLGDVVLGLFLTLIADRVGRRRVLLLGSLMMLLTGVIFALSSNFWLLLWAAVVGVVSATGGDYGPFRSIEESIVSQLTTSKTRSDVLVWYVTMSAIGSSVGSEVSGRFIHWLESRDDWTLVDAYHALFWIYAAAGIVNALLVCCLSQDCELDVVAPAYAHVSQEDRDSIELQRPEGVMPSQPSLEHAKAEKAAWWSRFSGQLSKISAPTRSVMYKLWALLALDSISDGMVPYTLTNYYMDQKFHPSKSTLGDITSVAYFLGAFGNIFAGPLARRIGLINTMVFTHIPSSAAVLLFPVPPNLVLAVILLLIRAGLNQMDQAPRSAFIAAVVKADERTAVLGITSMLRTLAAMMGPSITGVLAGNDRFWVAFVAGGAFRLTYDVGLYVLFVNMNVNQDEESSPSRMTGAHGSASDAASPLRDVERTPLTDVHGTNIHDNDDDDYDNDENDKDVESSSSGSLKARDVM